MREREEAVRLWNIVLDQRISDGADISSACLHQIGNGEYVVILSDEQQCAWFLWSHDDWKTLRRRAKAKAEKLRAEVRRKRQEKEGERIAV